MIMKILSQTECEALGWEFTTDLDTKFAYKKKDGKTVNGAKAKTITGVRMRITYIENNLKLKTA